MGYPRALTKEVLQAPSGSVVYMHRKEHQTKMQFANAVQQARSGWKVKYGITSVASVAGDTATITILQGLDKSPAAVAEMLERKAAPRALAPPRIVAPPPVEAPAPEPKEEPVSDPEARELWKELYLTSLRAMPAADPKMHTGHANAAVREFAHRFGLANG